MTMEELDTIRGYAIATVILAFIAVGLIANLHSPRLEKAKAYINGVTGLLGGIAGLGVFFLFHFITGWDEYFASQTTGSVTEYRGRHQSAARVIRSLGEMNTSTLGIVFGIVGLILLIFAFVNFRSLYMKPKASLKQ